MSVITDVAARFKHATFALKQRQIGLAVSGGGDSIAMMHLAVRTFGPEGFAVFSVDHGLRPEAAKELALVAAQATALGLPHYVARWTWDGAGNLQNAARVGRLAALRHMAIQHGKGAVWLGHTVDDQIETFLMRLARGSGVDGLTAMRRRTARHGWPMFRPLLDIERVALRDWLSTNDIAWCDDPSNDDTRFDRIKARQMGDELARLGLTPKRVLQTIDHMQAAQATLERAAARFADRHVRNDSGDLVFAPDALDLSHEDAPRRVMAAAFQWMAGQGHRPRFDNMIGAVKRAASGEQTTLAGCILVPQPDGAVRMTREIAATVPVTGPAPLIWDQKWRIAGPSDSEVTVKALGDDIVCCPDWRAAGHPRATLMASPAIWQNGELIAAPLAGLSNGWMAQIVANFHSRAFAIED
jgi:tRNA(Ile)-lysidine synthase